MGYTPWGTYLACEENFNGYFRKVATPAEPLTGMERRYGVGRQPRQPVVHHGQALRHQSENRTSPTASAGWSRFNSFDPEFDPVKRTALGRFKHEGAWVQEARDGRVVVYTGDDEQNEYIYRYVRACPGARRRAQGINPLDDGTLYVGQVQRRW